MNKRSYKNIMKACLSYYNNIAVNKPQNNNIKYGHNIGSNCSIGTVRTHHSKGHHNAL
jgi:hypothetical protein